MKLKLSQGVIMSNQFRILKRDGLFHIQKRVLIFFWIDLKENNNPAYETGCPPFETASEAKEWLAIYVKFHTDIIFPVKKIAIA